MPLPAAHLLQLLQTPTKLCNLPPQGSLLFAVCFPNCHTEDAGTCRGLWRPPCTGASIETQHQGVWTAAQEAAQCVEAAMRAEGKAGPAFIDIHVAMLSSPAWGTLAPVWSSADTSIKTRLGADGWGPFEKTVKTQTQGQLPASLPQPEVPASSPSQVRAPGCGFFQP